MMPHRPDNQTVRRVLDELRGVTASDTTGIEMESRGALNLNLAIHATGWGPPDVTGLAATVAAGGDVAAGRLGTTRHAAARLHRVLRTASNEAMVTVADRTALVAAVLRVVSAWTGTDGQPTVWCAPLCSDGLVLAGPGAALVLRVHKGVRAIA